MQLQSMAQPAKPSPAMGFHHVVHGMEREGLQEADPQPHKSRAPGMAQGTAQPYAEHRDENLRELHERRRDHRYGAPPVERGWSEKAEGKKRPRGQPGF